MIKKALIFFFISLGLCELQSPLDSDYLGDIYYPSNPQEFDDNRENHWSEIYFFYDSQCNLSTNTKEKLEEFFKSNKSLGNIFGSLFILISDFFRNFYFF